MRISEVLLSGGESRWIKTSSPPSCQSYHKVFTNNIIITPSPNVYFSGNYQEIYLDRGRVISRAQNWINRYVVEDLFCLQFFS